MAIIYSYPEKTSTTGTDQVLISDSQDDKKTKYVTMQTIADYIDGEVTLQEVLQTGSSATGNTGNNWAGNMSLTQGGNIVAPQIARRFIVDVNGLTGGGSNKTAYLVGDLEIAGNGASDAGDLNMSGSFEVVGNGTIAGNLNMSEATSDIIFSGGAITSTSLWGVQIRPSAGRNIDLDTGAGGNINLTGSGTADLIANMGGIIDITSTGNATFSTGTKDYLIADAASGDTTLEGRDTYIYTRGATGSVINIGGTISNTRPDSIMSQAENIFQVKTTTGSSRFYIHGGSGVDTPGINSVSSHSFYDEIRLGGTAATFNDTDGSVLTPGVQGDAGTAGQLLASGGAGASASWVSSSDLSVENLIEAVENNTGSLITKGTPLHISSNPSGTPRVEPADASVPSTMPASGLAYEDIQAGQSGEMIIAGQLEGIDTSTFGLGTVVYVNTGGGIGVRPVGAASLIQNVGIVTKVGGGVAGILQVTATGRSNDLPNNDANALFAASSTGTPISTIGKFEVNVSGNSMLIGDTAGATDVTINSSNFRGEVKNDTAAGVENLQIGYQSLQQAMDSGGTARSNVAIGIRSMQGQPAAGVAGGSYNVAVGNDTLNSNQNLFASVTGNVAIGHQALQGGPTNIADYNTAIGYQSLINLAGVAAGTADNNTAVGAFSLFNVTSGGENTSIGVGSGQAITGGNNNTFLGHNSGTTLGTINNATAIGQNADVNADGGVALGSNSVVTGVGGVALGARAIAAASRLNIKVDNIAGPNPQGGLPNFADRAAALAAGLTPGDVYCATPGGPDNPGTSFLLAII